jgi:sugar/nucleoside kinase (ribokinase family)
MSEALTNTMIAGEITRDYIVKSPTEVYMDIPGGPALYTAGGLMLWGENPGILSMVSDDFPQDWIKDFSQLGLDVLGIQRQEKPKNHLRFYGYLDENQIQTDNPITYFDQTNLPFPKELIGYQSQKVELDNRNATAPKFCRINDIPASYLNCPSIHLCAMDFLSSQILPDAMRQGNTTNISLQASASYMDPLFLEMIPYLVNHLAVFHTSEANLRALFQNRSKDLWEMAEALGKFGCELLLIYRSNHTIFLYNGHSKEKWIIPAYPVEVTNIIGIEESFCGGFFANFRKTFDPVESALYGAISASFTAQGFGPFFSLDAYPGLPEARLLSLREAVRKL